MSEPATEIDAFLVMQKVASAWERGDLNALRALLHPDGAWFFVGSVRRTINDPDELIEAIERERETGPYQLGPVRNEPLGRGVVLAAGFIRTAPPGGRGHQVSRHVFLTAVRDRLFYASDEFGSEQEARNAFETGWPPDVNRRQVDTPSSASS